ncbi:MAG TPA: hypothetical protein VGY55_08175 [Pirellulales bacterium]|jgi:hypothetical protein|nr:hypothetical protein [Pirellulales bacterium]
MDTLRKQVARARRRLILGRFLAALAWSWTAALFVAAIAIAVAKIWPLGIDGWAWSAGWIGGAVLAGLLSAGLWTWLHRDDSLAAAIEIDHRFGLKERVSSALALPQSELQSDVGQALVNDAIRRIERIDVGSRFHVPLGRRNLVPLLPALLAFSLTFISDRGQEPEANAAIQPPNSQQLQQSAEALRKKLAERQKEAAEQGLKDGGDLFKKIEQGIKDLAKKDGLDQKQALVKLNDFAKELEARREKLGGDDKLKQQLGQMKDLKNGPAEKLADALKNGDFQKAIKELDKLKDALNNDKLDPEKQKQLAEQLDAMRKSLEKMVEKHEQAKKELERQIQQMTAAGKSAEAQKLQQQLDKLQQQSSQMNQLKQLAGQCKQCAGALQSGKAGAAKYALDQLRGQLSDLKQQSDELAMLDLTLDQISDCKAGMCKCDGQGNCNIDSDRLVGETNGGGKARASGHRPEQPTDTKFYDSSVKQKMTKGAAVSVGEAEGPNIKGRVQEEIKAQIESAKHDSADPLTGQRLPRSQREHAKEYFDALRDGK